MSNELEEITVPSIPTEMLDSQYGIIQIKDWLKKEKSRLELQDRTAEIREDKKGNISLWANNLIKRQSRRRVYA